MADYRFLAQRLTGDGPGEWLDPELPLTDPAVTDVLSGPPQLTASIDPVYARLAGDRRPLLEEWGTAVYAEADGIIRGGWIVADAPVDGPKLTVDGTGFCGYPTDMPYLGDYSGVQVDPLEVVREVWDHLQSQPGGNLGMVVDPTTSPVRIGTPPEQVEFTAGGAPAETEAAQAILDRLNSGQPILEDWTWTGAPASVGQYNDDLLAGYGGDPLNVAAATAWLGNYITTHGGGNTGEQVSFEAGPYKLNWWSTDDCGKQIDDLAKSTPFDYHEAHAWNGDRTQVEHRLELGYPRIGRRRDDLRFVYGENVTILPQVTRGGDQAANEVLVLGAGEGRDMIRGSAPVRDGRLRRVATIADKSIRSLTAANERARRELSARQGLTGVTSITVADMQGARLGDEIRLQAEGDWLDLDLWVRIVSATTNPLRGDTAVLSVVRADVAG